MVTAIIPTLNEAKRIGEIIEFLKKSPLISEVIVIDDGSTDATFAIAKRKGAKVYLSSMLGKGASMADGLGRAQNDNILFLDGDIYGFSPDLIERMLTPVLANQADFVKGKFQRKAGRVTTLTAKPLLKMFFPELADFEQPLGGIVSGNKSFLEKVSFENDYGVDIGLLIDIHQFGARVAEVDIGFIEHDHQTLEALSNMSLQIVRTILNRASKYRKLHAASIHESSERDRVSGVQFGSVLDKIHPSKKLALFDMDGTVIEGSFIEYISSFTGRRSELKGLLGNHQLDPVYRTEMIAKVLSGIPKHTFEKIAMTIPLKPLAQETVIELKKKGFQVGIITDSYFIASEIVRKRIFADFSIAHLLQFKKGIATGDISISPFMQIQDGCPDHKICKSNFVRHLSENSLKQSQHIVSFGNGENDICLFQNSNHSFAVFPQNMKVATAAHLHIRSLFDAVSHLK